MNYDSDSPPDGLSPREVRFWWTKKRVRAALRDTLTARQVLEVVKERGVTVWAAMYELESEGEVIHEGAGPLRAGYWRRKW